MKIFILNGGQKFAHSGGEFNKTVTSWTKKFFQEQKKAEYKITNLNEEYELQEEVNKFIWADIIIYHMPIWWFQLPNIVKKYFDEVFTHGHNKGIYKNDGRSRTNPDINYGTGGLLQNKKYMLTTSWNAPETAFTFPGEFFGQKTIDESVMFGFHRMNAFIVMQPLESFHFHDMVKSVTPEKISRLKQDYTDHLKKVFTS